MCIYILPSDYKHSSSTEDGLESFAFTSPSDSLATTSGTVSTVATNFFSFALRAAALLFLAFFLPAASFARS